MRGLLHALAVVAVAASASFAQVKTDDHAKVMDGLRGKEDHVGAWQRYPIAGIPLVDKAPVIDGVVDAREWFAAARLGRFVEYNSGIATRDRTEMYLCYTPTHLYMAFQIERPDNARMPGPRDVLEVLFDAWHGHAKYYSVGFHLDKVLWDGVGPNVVDKAWDPRVAIQSPPDRVRLGRRSRRVLQGLQPRRRARPRHDLGARTSSAMRRPPSTASPSGPIAARTGMR